MESRFGRDLGSVRIHTDAGAGRLAEQMQAHAFTTGSQIFFAPRAFAPDSRSGGHLLAHELAHVVQQDCVTRQGIPAIQRRSKHGPSGCKACPAYCSFDSSFDLSSFNCAGLALRTYGFHDMTALGKEFSRFGTKTPCGSPCDAVGKIKFWMWTYDSRLLDNPRSKVLANYPTDFHTVAGPTWGTPLKDAQEVYSKDGERPVKGPAAPMSFKPKVLEQTTWNEPAERPLMDPSNKRAYLERSNITENCHCLPCPETEESAKSSKPSKPSKSQAPKKKRRPKSRRRPPGQQKSKI